MTTLVLKRPLPKLKPDLEPARWWAVIIGDDGEMTRRTEVAWGQDPIAFKPVIRGGFARRLAVYDAEDGGTAWIEGILTPLDSILPVCPDITVHVSNIAWPGR